MTDISDWASTIHIMKTRAINWITGEAEDRFVERLMIPLNAYQMANLIDALTQSDENGDWYGEFCDIVYRSMQVLGLKELSSNSGKVFTLEDVRSRLQKYRK